MMQKSLHNSIYTGVFLWFQITVANQHNSVCVCRQTLTRVLRTPCLLSRHEAAGIQIFEVEGREALQYVLHF